jgi:hypothetical protein
MKEAQRIYDASVKAIAELETASSTNPANR